jgi:hypothetical protein
MSEKAESQQGATFMSIEPQFLTKLHTPPVYSDSSVSRETYTKTADEHSNATLHLQSSCTVFNLQTATFSDTNLC